MLELIIFVDVFAIYDNINIKMFSLETTGQNSMIGGIIVSYGVMRKLNV